MPELQPVAARVTQDLNQSSTQDKKDSSQEQVCAVVEDGALKGDVDNVYDEQYSEEEYTRIKKKVDWVLLPLMWWCYGIQMTDKVGLSNMNLFGLQKDTGMHGQDYAMLSVIFYVAYAVFEFPSVWLIQRWHVGKALTVYMFIWGLVVMSQTFLQTWPQFMALRFLQGVFECSISPGFNYLIASWYTKREHSSRSLVFQSGNCGWGIVVDLVTYAIAKKALGHGSRYLNAWRGITLFLGLQTILAAIACWFILGTPHEVRWLNARDKKIAVARVAVNCAGNDETGTKGWDWSQVREAFLGDPVLYFQFANSFLAAFTNGAITTFGTVVIKSFGFDEFQVLLVGLPRYAFSLSWFALVGWTSLKYLNVRMYWMIASTVIPFVGLLVIALLPYEPRYRWIKFAMYTISYIFTIPSFSAWALISSNTAGKTKFSVISAMTFIAYCAGNLAGAQIMKAKDAPRYIPGTIAISVGMAAECGVIIAWRLWLVYQNRKRAAWIREQGITADEAERRGRDLGNMDTTDMKNPYFVYSM